MHHAKALFNATHPSLQGDEGVQALGAGARQLGDLLASVLGTPLDFGISGIEPAARLFGRRYVEDELSTGQHLLLTWMLLLHEQRTEITEGSVVFLDEPERQLHPKAAIEVLERLLEAVGAEGQLWIATHCPAIVAHFGRESVYYVDRHGVRYAGSRIDEVMDGLLGGPESRRTFADFLYDADQLNLQRYAVESLFAPGVAGHAGSDPQERQFTKIVRRALDGTDTRLRLLDYGAGRGRFALALADGLPPELRDRIDYHAYNDRHHDGHHDECVRAIARLHPDDAPRRLSVEPSDFFGKNAVDLVVMSNFLHEVEPREWRTHFRRAADVLRDDGVLIVMEDQEPPVGELPTREGFVVLDLEGLRRLFGKTAAIRSVLEPNPRLTAFEIPKALLDTYSDTHLRDALEATADQAKAELRRLRAGGATGTPQSLGRRHAFFALLFASASMALDGLGGH
jgi:hypothetical protein